MHDSNQPRGRNQARLPVFSIRKRLLMVAAAIALYAPAYTLLSRWFADDIGELSILPAVVAGWLLGRRGGLLAGLLLVPLNLALLRLGGLPGWDAWRRATSLPDVLVVLLTGSAAGWLSELLGRVKHQSVELACERELLRAEIAERERVDAELRLQRDFALQVVSTMGQGLTVTDEQGRFEFVNPAFEQLFGYSFEEALGRSPFDIVLPADHALLSNVRARRRSGETVTYEARLRNAQGGVMYAMITTVPRIPDRPVAGAIAVYTDITERKRVEAALQRRDAILDAVSFAAARFLETVGWKGRIQAVLAGLGAAADVSRVYIFENYAGAAGELLSNQRYEWVAPGVTPQIASPELQGFSFRARGFQRWEAALGRGDVIDGHVAAFPPAERDLLAAHDIRSIAVVPIFAGPSWWGHIGFDDCRAEREWSSAEMDALKTAAGIIGAAIEREQSEAALRASERRYRELFDAAQRQAQELALLDRVRTALASEIDPPAMFRTVVEAIAETFGYTQVSIYLVEGDALRLQHQVGYDRVLERIPLTQGVSGRVARQGQPTLLEDVRAEPTFLGAIEGISSEICIPLFDQGQVVGILNVESVHGVRLSEPDLQLVLAVGEHINMVFARARLYAEIRESEERYRRLVEFSPDPILVHSAGRIMFTNPAGVDLLGAAAAEDLIGKPALDFVHPDYREMVTARMRQTQEENRQADMQEETFVRLDGQLIDVEVVGIPTTYLGRPATQVVLRDITERKRMEAERLAFERRLLETQKLESLGVLAGGIAHDFNNLLMGILGNTTLALLDLPPASPAEYSLRQIESAARRAADLTKQMLAYSGRGHFNVQALDLNTLVEEMSRLSQVSFGKQVALEHRLDEELPTITADAAQMRQLLMSLIVNASEAIGDAPGSVSLTTGVRHCTSAYLATTYLAPDLPSGSYVYLEVVDTGCGIDAGTLARIFEPFFTTKFTGRGLGLAAAIGIVRGHRGAISVQSQPGRGSTFTVFLPASEAPRSRRAGAAEPVSGDRAAPRAGSVLVVEDDVGLRALTARMLEHFGYTVLTAADGGSGIETFRAQADTIDCVLLDMYMPQMDGEQTCREIRRIKPQARVVLMSGYDEQQLAGHFADLDLAGILQKPFSPDTLCEQVRRAIARG